MPTTTNRTPKTFREAVKFGFLDTWRKATILPMLWLKTFLISLAVLALGELIYPGFIELVETWLR